MSVYSIPLIYSSCDKYASLGEGFFCNLYKFFPSFRGPIFGTLSTDRIFHGYPVTGLGKAGEGLDFSSRILLALDKCKDHEFVLFTLDDFFINAPVDELALERAFKLILDEPEIGFINLWDFFSKGTSDFIDCPKGMKFRISTQFGLWRVSYLKRVLRRGESGWDLERFGSIRSSYFAERVLWASNRKSSIVPYPEGGIVNEGCLRSTIGIRDLTQYPDLITTFNHPKPIHKYGFLYKLCYLFLFPLRSIYSKWWPWYSSKSAKARFWSKFWNLKGNPFV